MGLAHDALQLVLRGLEMPLAGDHVDVLEPADVIELAKDIDLALLAIDFKQVDARQFESLEQLADRDRIGQLPRTVGALEFVARIDVVSFFAAIEAEHGEILWARAAPGRIPDQQLVMVAQRLEA